MLDERSGGHHIERIVGERKMQCVALDRRKGIETQKLTVQVEGHNTSYPGYKRIDSLGKQSIGASQVEKPVYPAGKQPVNTGADGGYPALKTEFDRGEVEADVMVIFRMQSP